MRFEIAPFLFLYILKIIIRNKVHLHTYSSGRISSVSFSPKSFVKFRTEQIQNILKYKKDILSPLFIQVQV